jgi:hypothetical protein
MPTTPASPVRLEAHLDPRLSRWLWLFKWLLLIPHLVVLFLLWVGFGVLSVVAFFAILFTGRYPRSLFDFNVGVLRWSWRVAFYGSGAFGTDRYPPFSLDDHPEYPATLNVEYPARLSHGLVLVKWLLALPHLLIVSVFVGSGAYLAGQFGEWAFTFGGGLVGLLALVAAVALMITGRYPQGLFDFILGLDRWVLRVAAYVGLMTDTYPPFRFDAGGADPARAVGKDVGLPAAPVGLQPPRSRWSAGGIVAVITGSLLVLGGLGLGTGGTALLIADSVARDSSGLITTPTETFSGAGYAVAFGGADISWSDGNWAAETDWLGEVQIVAHSTSSDIPLFVGIGAESDVNRYLTGVQVERVSQVDLFPFRVGYTEQQGSAPTTPPTTQDFWVESIAGVGEQTLTWRAEPGHWALVLMNADGSPNVTAALRVAADAPFLAPLGWALVGGGIVMILLGGTIVLLGAIGVRRRESPLPPPPSAGSSPVTTSGYGQSSPLNTS